MNKYEVYNWIVKIIQSSSKEHKEACERLIQRHYDNYSDRWLSEQLVKNYKLKFKDNDNI